MNSEPCRKTSPAGTLYSFFILFFCSLTSIASVSDTTKSKYALNDPRNPDCPCHQYQRMADEEYRRNQSHNYENTSLNKAPKDKHRKIISSDNTGPSHTIKGKKLKRKVKLKRILFLKKIKSTRAKGRKWIKTDPDTCFKWQ
ncbi:MAG: hypothetical protein M3R27_06780 [Bacteroidota bacterium]|nr:hypothetical protein [Bacteroidota bacterium]